MPSRPENLQATATSHWPTQRKCSPREHSDWSYHSPSSPFAQRPNTTRPCARKTLCSIDLSMSCVVAGRIPFADWIWMHSGSHVRQQRSESCLSPSARRCLRRCGRYIVPFGDAKGSCAKLNGDARALVGLCAFIFFKFAQTRPRVLLARNHGVCVDTAGRIWPIHSRPDERDIRLMLRTKCIIWIDCPQPSSSSSSSSASLLGSSRPYPPLHHLASASRRALFFAQTANQKILPARKHGLDVHKTGKI